MMKPDMFEQAVEKWAMEPMTEGCDVRDEMAKLLRQHHAKVRRMVTKMMTERMREYEREICDEKRTAHSKTDASIRGWAVKDMRDDLLAQLDAMAGKKGKP